MRLSKQKLAIDIGSQNIRIYSRDSLVFDEPCFVAQDKKSGSIIAIGKDAQEYTYSSIRSVRILKPLSKGRITDVQSAEIILKYALRQALRRPLLTRPQAIINIVGTATSAERRALINTCKKANIGNVQFIENTLAAAIGAVLPIADSHGYGILDIGHEKTECSIFAVGSKVGYSYIGYGGKDIIEYVAKKIRQNHGLRVGKREVLQIIAHDHTKRKSIKIWGVNTSGSPDQIELSLREIELYRTQTLQRIISLVRTALEDVSPDIIADLYKAGMTITGGVAAMPRLGTIMQTQINIPFFIDPHNSHTICKGAYIAVNET